MEKREHIKAFAIGTLILLVAWWAIGHWTFALRHPELTSTQRFLRTKDALLFR